MSKPFRFAGPAQKPVRSPEIPNRLADNPGLVLGLEIAQSMPREELLPSLIQVSKLNENPKVRQFYKQVSLRRAGTMLSMKTDSFLHILCLSQLVLFSPSHDAEIDEAESED